MIHTYDLFSRENSKVFTREKSHPPNVVQLMIWLRRGRPCFCCRLECVRDGTHAHTATWIICRVWQVRMYFERCSDTHTLTHTHTSCSYLGDKLLSVIKVQWRSLSWWPQVTGWSEEHQYTGTGTEQTNIICYLIIIIDIFLAYSLILHICCIKDHAVNSQFIWMSLSPPLIVFIFWLYLSFGENS